MEGDQMLPQIARNARCPLIASSQPRRHFRQARGRLPISTAAYRLSGQKKLRQYLQSWTLSSRSVVQLVAGNVRASERQSEPGSHFGWGAV
jgi:hypothetical protein